MSILSVSSVFLMHPAIICSYWIGYEKLSFPKRTEIIF